MNTLRIEEMALFLTLVLISISCVSATAVQDSQIEIISTKPAGEQPPTVLNQEQNSTPDINSVLKELSVQLAENKVEIKKLQKQNEEQSTTLKELEVQKSELEKLQQQQQQQLQEQQQQYKQLQEQQQQHKQLQEQQQQYKQQQEQQQEDIQHLQNQIQTQAAELVSIKSKANMNEEALRNDREVTKVAFSVSLRDSGFGHTGFTGPFNTHITMIFKNIIENIGNAYSPQTGNFTAPVRGAYHFEFNIYGLGDDSYYTGVRLIKNEKIICSISEYQFTGRYQSSNGATLLLEVGDVVFVVQGLNTVIFDDVNLHYTTFSGHLLFTM